MSGVWEKEEQTELLEMKMKDRGRNRSESLLFQTACRMIIFPILTERRIIIRGVLRCGAIMEYFHIGTQAHAACL